MIDTDKYKGLTQGHWELESYFSGWKIYWFDKELSDNWDSIRDFGEEYRHEDFCYDVGVVASTEANARLMADAPLLLAEVKRLREVMIYVEQRQPHPALEWALKEGLTLAEIMERVE